MTAEVEPGPPAVTLEESVRRSLAGRAAVRGLRVFVEDGGVILEGRSATYYGKQLAQHAALRASGRPLLANYIVVDRGSGT